MLSDELMLNARDIRAAIGQIIPLRPSFSTAEPLVFETFSQARQRFDRQLIEQALMNCSGSVVEAASQLGLGRSTLYKKMAALGIAESQ